MRSLCSKTQPPLQRYSNRTLSPIFGIAKRYFTDKFEVPPKNLTHTFSFKKTKPIENAIDLIDGKTQKQIVVTDPVADVNRKKDLFRTAANAIICRDVLFAQEMLNDKKITEEELKHIIDTVVHDSQKKNLLLTAFAIVRGDNLFIQQMLDTKMITQEEFKNITIPVELMSVYLQFSPLKIAIARRNLDLVKTLIENGFSPIDKLDEPRFGFSYSCTPVTEAFEKNCLDIVDYLCSKGANKQIDFEIDHCGLNLDGPFFKLSHTSDELKKFDILKIIFSILSQLENIDK
jgi:hypothetical protein